MFSRNIKQKSSRSSRSPSHSPSRSPPPAPASKEPQLNKNNGNSFTDSIVSGFGFGIGSSIAHKMTDSIFTKPNDTANNNEKNDTTNNNEKNIVCNELKSQLNICVTESNSDCKNLYDNFFNNCK